MLMLPCPSPLRSWHTWDTGSLERVGEPEEAGHGREAAALWELPSLAQLLQDTGGPLSTPPGAAQPPARQGAPSLPDTAGWLGVWSRAAASCPLRAAGVPPTLQLSAASASAVPGLDFEAGLLPPLSPFNALLPEPDPGLEGGEASPASTAPLESGSISARSSEQPSSAAAAEPAPRQPPRSQVRLPSILRAGRAGQRLPGQQGKPGIRQSCGCLHRARAGTRCTRRVIPR